MSQLVERDTLFVPEVFTSSSGLVLTGKIECDALTARDWIGIVALCRGAGLLDEPYGEVYGVMRGGVPFADALTPFVTQGPRLVVDDVLTTGASILSCLRRPSDRGLVAFARGPLPPRVTALFTMPPPRLVERPSGGSGGQGNRRPDNPGAPASHPEDEDS